MFNLEYIGDIFKKNIIAIISIIFGIIGLTLGGGCLYYYNFIKICNPDETNSAIQENITLTEEIDEEIYLKVDVKGAVKKAGVYELPIGSNIQDAIALAGGITSKGSTKNINLAKKLKDEMVIYVFTKDELKKAEDNNQIVCEIPECKCETIVVNECPSIDQTLTDNSNNNENQEKKISLNTATLEQLMTLNGIGESKAKNIIEYREKNGLFKSIEELKNVSGIGEAAYEKIKDYITI